MEIFFSTIDAAEQVISKFCCDYGYLDDAWGNVLVSEYIRLSEILSEIENYDFGGIVFHPDYCPIDMTPTERQSISSFLKYEKSVDEAIRNIYLVGYSV